MIDLIERQKAIDAICSVCGNDCDKSEFVYGAPQDEQVILCPEHYALTMLPSVKPVFKTGRWINGEEEKGACNIVYTEHICSECGYSHSFPLKYNFCPECGSYNGGDSDDS